MAAPSAQPSQAPPLATLPAVSRPRVLTPAGVGDSMTWVTAQHGRCLLRAISPSLLPRTATDFTPCGAVAIDVCVREVQSDGAAELTVSPAVHGEHQSETKRPRLLNASGSANPNVSCTFGCGAWWAEMRLPGVMPDHGVENSWANRGIGLAAVAVPLDQHGRVLLTRRPRHMRTFPGCWVLPGGSVDPAESTLAAALRELHEETGLRPSRQPSTQPFAMWEVRVTHCSCLDTSRNGVQ